MSKNQNRTQVDLAEQLRAAVRAAGLTTYSLAREAEIDSSVVVRFMNGTRGITLDSASRLATCLGLELRPIRKGR